MLEQSQRLQFEIEYPAAAAADNVDAEAVNRLTSMAWKSN